MHETDPAPPAPSAETGDSTAPCRTTTDRALYIFLDGIGLGRDEPANPCSSAPMPFLRRLLGRALVDGPPIDRPGLLLTGIDACLGVDGHPQSATGQTALFTGINAPAELGYHHPAYPEEHLTAMLNRYSILKRAAEAGLRTSFANAYTERYFLEVEQGRLAHSATTLAVLAAGLRFRMMDELRRGDAVYWDITNDTLHALQRRIPDAPPQITPETAGANLARLARRHDLLLYECFAPDLIGHRRDRRQAVEWLRILDRFLEATVAGLDHRTTLVLSSDHGNMEQIDVVTHTRNPVPLLVIGPQAQAFARVQAITGVTPTILELLGAEGPRPDPPFPAT